MQRDPDYRVVIDTTPALDFRRAYGRLSITSTAHSSSISERRFTISKVPPDEVRSSDDPGASSALARSAGECAGDLGSSLPQRRTASTVGRSYTRSAARRSRRGGPVVRCGHRHRTREAREETLRNAEKDVRTILETIPAVVWTARPDGGLDFISRSWSDRMGGERGGWSWTDVVHPDDIERVVYGWREALDSGRPLDQELRLRERDESYRWYLVRAVPRRDDAGAILRWYGTITDIDARKRAEEEPRLKDQPTERTSPCATRSRRRRCSRRSSALQAAAPRSSSWRRSQQPIRRFSSPVRRAPERN
jgi:PAS domain S-box-containing protein